MGVKRVNQ